MIRAAKFGDIPRLTALFEEGHKRSKYAQRATLDVKETKSLLMQSIQRHGGGHPGSTFVVVSERGERVDGFFIGVLQRVYHVAVELEATDLHFFMPVGSTDTRKIISAFEEWAQANERVIAITLGVTDVIGDPDRTGVIYERRGYKKVGAIWQRSLR